MPGGGAPSVNRLGWPEEPPRLSGVSKLFCTYVPRYDGYTDEGIVGYLHQGNDTGTVALTRYVNPSTGSHFYSVTGTDVPQGYTPDGSPVGYLDSTNPDGNRLPLTRFYSTTTNDYLLDTSASTPPGYGEPVLLGYLRPTVGGTGAALTTVYTRNALGQVTQVIGQAVTYTYTYDAAHRLKTVWDSRGPKSLTYTYSPGGLRNSVTDSDGNRTSYLYDPVGRLAGIWAPTGDLVAFAYDAGGRLTEKVFPNGGRTRYAYNPDNTLAQLTNYRGPADSALISQHDYTYDGVGNRITHLERLGDTSTHYGYT